MESSLYEFVVSAWPIVEPSERFCGGWHIEAICDHLQELVSDTPRFTDLLINVPPGHMKSLLTCVFWPTWDWTMRPEKRWLFAGYSDSNPIRDSLKRRSIITSEWYQRLWPLKLVGDQNAKIKYENCATGWMLSTSVGGAGTGEHPDRIVIDDPHKADEALSSASREHVESWFSNTVSSRGLTRDVRRAVVMQRLHRADLSGVLLKRGGWVHLCFPFQYEPGRMPRTPLGFQDPRTEPDELLWSAITEKAKEKLLSMSAYDAAGQLQQKPPGQDSKSEWPSAYFDDAETFDDWPELLSIRVSYLDPSLGKTEKADYAAIVSLAIDMEGVIYVDAEIERSDTTVMADRCVANGRDFTPQAFGIEANGFQSLLCQPIHEACMKQNGMQLPIWPIVNVDNKELRIRRLTPYFRAGNVRYRNTPGCRMLVEQLREFPHGKHDDGPDAFEGAVRLVQAVWSGAGNEDATTEEVSI